jgi:quercetin dioxygenase-like cupin family protein
LHVPRGVAHDWWNAGGEEAQVLFEISPAARFEAMILNAFGFARDGKTDAKGKPRLLQAALFAREFDDVIRFTKPPRPVQRLLFGALAPVARLLGYKGSYPEYLRRPSPAGAPEAEPWREPVSRTPSKIGEEEIAERIRERIGETANGTARREKEMVKAGDEMVNEVTGLRTIFRKTAQDTDGELLQVDWIGAPGWSAGPKHVHRKQLERFTVISGTLGAHVDGADGLYGPGEVAVAPAGSVHTAWNGGKDGEEVHALVEFEPALRSEVPLETLAGLARDGKVNKAGVPKNPFRLALLINDYEDELYLTSPPLFVQRVLFGPLAFVGRLLGYRAEYPYPSARRGDVSGAAPRPDVVQRTH